MMPGMMPMMPPPGMMPTMMPSAPLPCPTGMMPGMVPNMGAGTGGMMPGMMMTGMPLQTGTAMVAPSMSGTQPASLLNPSVEKAFPLEKKDVEKAGKTPKGRRCKSAKAEHMEDIASALEQLAVLGAKGCQDPVSEMVSAMRKKGMDVNKLESMMNAMADQIEGMLKMMGGKGGGLPGMDPMAMMMSMGAGEMPDPAKMAAMMGKKSSNKKAGSKKGDDSMSATDSAGASAGAGVKNKSDAEKAQMQIWAAAADAQQTQYLQQYQFYQQMRAQDEQNKAKVAAPEVSRFKENFRPMRLCKHLIMLGICRPGRDCTFAHTFDELHPASPDLPDDFNKESEPVATGALAEQGEVEESRVPDMRLKKKKEMCGRYSRGECSLGKICPFAHTESELGTVGLAVCGKVKTRLCVFWDAATGSAKGCIYGKNCNNAHGEWEIGTKRPPPELCPPMKRRRDGESVIAGR
eukprot:TRINITY_DN28850_c0_g1_i1.p1 TRINITY_DN28850_c0_g1~~TRINITY_DN28850_c0_g1_i1.p1  ORF type:complete len:462 (-),score=66.89 TRINITY_DN28850_c0_g1_i1:34-1419(-)